MRYIVIDQGCCVDGRKLDMRGASHTQEGAKRIAFEQADLYDIDHDHIVVLDTITGTTYDHWDLF